MPPKSGVLYVVWGEVEEQLRRSIMSLRAVHPELPVHIHRLPAGSDLLDKAGMFDWTPFEHTLFLDADTVVLRRLDFGFEKAARHGLACCINEFPWARRYPSVDGDVIEYNTGVMFFSRKAEPVFRAWHACARSIDSSSRLEVGRQVCNMRTNDQAGFARAVEETNFCPFVLPLNWNFRPHFQKIYCGPLVIWHAYEEMPPHLVMQNREPRQDGRVLHFTVIQ